MNNHLHLPKREDLESIARWEIIFEMLSMQRVQPFLAEIGLRVPKTDVLRSIAQQFLEQIEKSGDNIDEQKELLQHTLAKVAAEINDETAQTLYLWGIGKFALRSQKGLIVWGLLLHWLAGLSYTSYPVNLPYLDPQKVEALISEVREKFADSLSLEQKLEEAERLPKSDWEEKIYRSGEEGYSPLALVSNIITDYRTHQILDFIKISFSEDEIKTLVQWAKDNAPSLGLDEASIESPF